MIKCRCDRCLDAPGQHIKHLNEARDTARLTTEPADFPGTVESYAEACLSAYCNCDRCNHPDLFEPAMFNWSKDMYVAEKAAQEFSEQTTDEY